MSSAVSRADRDQSGGRAEPQTGRTRMRRSLRQSGPILVVLVVLYAWVGYLNPRFLEPEQILLLLQRAAPLMVLAAGQLFVIVTGGFDLSVGSLVTVTVVVAARLIGGDDAATWPVLALLFGIGALVGLVNGLVTTRLRVPSFITTLGMLLILRGAVFYWTGGAPRGALSETFRAFGRQGIELPVIGELPYAVIVLVAVGGVAVFLLHRTAFGQQLFAAGGGARAAALSGVSVANVRTVAFMLSGVLAVVAGILLGGFAGVSAQVGEGAEFRAISAVVLGGAVLGGGKGSMVGVLLGALVLEVLFLLLNLLGFPQPVREAVQGLIIIGAVGYSVHRGRKMA